MLSLSPSSALDFLKICYRQPAGKPTEKMTALAACFHCALFADSKPLVIVLMMDEEEEGYIKLDGSSLPQISARSRGFALGQRCEFMCQCLPKLSSTKKDPLQVYQFL